MESLDAFIGLISIYLVLSLIVTAFAEGWSSFRHAKARALGKVIRRILGNDGFYDFYSHENIIRISVESDVQSSKVYEREYVWMDIWDWLLGKEREEFTANPSKKKIAKRGPSYLPPELFAETIIDIIVNRQQGRKLPATTINIDKGLQKLHAEKVLADAKRLVQQRDLPDQGETSKLLPEELTFVSKLQELWRSAEFNVEEFNTLLTKWFNQTAERSHGYYKRKMGLYSLFFGIFIALAVNADSISMFKQLLNDPNLREKQAEYASQLLEQATISPTDTESQLVDTDASEEARNAACEALGIDDPCTSNTIAKAAADQLLPFLGWESVDDRFKCTLLSNHNCAVTMDGFLFWSYKLIGLLLTAFAISLGAPFWFDLLQKISQIRGAIRSTGIIKDSKHESSATGGSAAGTIPAAKTFLTQASIDDDDTDNLGEFRHDKLGFDLLNIYWCARLADMAYLSADEISSSLEGIGAGGTLLELPMKDTQCLIAFTPALAIVSFRGSEKKLEDWATNLDVTQREPMWLGEHEAKLHRGFSMALDFAWDEIIATLKAEKVFEKGLPIWFTGHSLGGALATLGALRMTMELPQMDTDTVIGGLYTYGQPRVGDSSLCELIDSQLPNRYTRSINQRDAVARIPFTVTLDQQYEYAHAGRVIYFNESGKALMDPPIWYRTLDVASISSDIKVLKNALKEAAGDHSMKEYVRLHRELLNRETE